MSTTAKLRGFSNISFYADDHHAAKRWYTALFGVEPYFNRPGYSEWRIGDYEHEFGLIDGKYRPKAAQAGPGGAIMSWHVDDVKGTLEHLLSKGAKEYEPIIERGEGFVTASVIDPFGNILGIMYNPHYLEVLHAEEASTPGLQ
ncbi:VOC family protein [Fulvivirgaceae bacterium PWU5]|uniref:VOC family protein n=1 Tax=Dawidia cretensis TaxID=2782350 RepID=A0AAP2E0R7_9BACT|nr:VOC family protein [Dawidia cretensis]MBT1710650.1 VOC family protein [Dawidia cretensis]